MAKPSCSCEPKQKGCSHFLSGKCRLIEKNRELEECVMNEAGYHYACCSFLNSDQGKKALAIFTIIRDWAYKIECKHEPKNTDCIAKIGWRCTLTNYECMMKKPHFCGECCPIPKIIRSQNIQGDITSIIPVKGGKLNAEYTSS